MRFKDTITHCFYYRIEYAQKIGILTRMLENPHLSALTQFSSTDLSTASVDKESGLAALSASLYPTRPFQEISALGEPK
jgi:hypothetical protein